MNKPRLEDKDKVAKVYNSKGEVCETFSFRDHGNSYLSAAQNYLMQNYDKLMAEETEQMDEALVATPRKHILKLEKQDPDNSLLFFDYKTSKSPKAYKVKRYNVHHRDTDEKVGEIDHIQNYHGPSFKGKIYGKSIPEDSNAPDAQKLLNHLERTGFAKKASEMKEEVEQMDEGNKENKKKKNEYVSNIIKKKLSPEVLPSLKYGRQELKKEEVEQMDEVSRSLAGRYIGAASEKEKEEKKKGKEFVQQMKDAGMKGIGTPLRHKGPHMGKYSREAMIKLAVNKLTNPDFPVSDRVKVPATESVEHITEMHKLKLHSTKKEKAKGHGTSLYKSPATVKSYNVHRNEPGHSLHGEKVGEIHHVENDDGPSFHGNLYGKNLPDYNAPGKLTAQKFLDHLERTGFAKKASEMKEEVEQMDEAHKINDPVEIVKGPGKGTKGYIGEIRHGLYKGAPKTYTVFHGPHGATRVNKEQIRKIKEKVEQMDEAYTVKLTKTEHLKDVTDDMDQPVKAVDRHYDIHDENGKKVGEVLHHYNQYGGHFYNGHIHGSNIPYDRQKITDLKQNAQAFINGVEKTKWHSKLLERVAKRQQKQQQKEEVEQMDEDRASDLNAASGFGQMKYEPFEYRHQKMKDYRAKYVAESDGQFRGMILRDLATRTNSKSGKSHIDHLRGEGHSMKDIHDAVDHATDIHGDWPEGHGISSSDRNAFIRTVYSALGHKTVEEGYIEEKLTKGMSAGEIISDFVHSDDPKFDGKSKEERKRMALGAYYDMHPEKSKNESVENKYLSNIIAKLEEGRKPKPGSKAWDRQQERLKAGGAETETPHVVTQLMKHADYGDKSHTYKFSDGSTHEVTAKQRDKILAKLRSMTGPGKRPEDREKLYREVNTAKGFFHHTGDKPMEPEKRHPMSLQK